MRKLRDNIYQIHEDIDWSKTDIVFINFQQNIDFSCQIYDVEYTIKILQAYAEKLKIGLQEKKSNQTKVCSNE